MHLRKPLTIKGKKGREGFEGCNFFSWIFKGSVGIQVKWGRKGREWHDIAIIVHYMPETR